jgi:DNA-directed RNA polymerase II subunit RPB3
MDKPNISNLSDEDGILHFTLSNINVSLANGLRRIIISEVPTIVFRTTPHDKNKSTTFTNTTRLNNELIKQRLSCIPIHISDTDFPYEDFIVQIHVKNDSNIIRYITTKDFKIKNIKNDTYLSEAQTREIFPPDVISGDYINFVRLRPQLSATIPGEELNMECLFDIGTSKQDSAFNIVSTCAYGYTPDPVKINEVWTEKAREMKIAGVNNEEIEYAHKDWLLLEAKRYYKPGSFDFTIESIGQFTNMSIIHKATNIMKQKLKTFANVLQSNSSIITPSDTTIENSYDIKLENEDYTLGKVLEYILYQKHFNRNETSGSDNKLSFCGFRKAHPHDDWSTIRLGFVDTTPSVDVIVYLTAAITDALTIFKYIEDEFSD